MNYQLIETGVVYTHSEYLDRYLSDAPKTYILFYGQKVFKSSYKTEYFYLDFRKDLHLNSIYAWKFEYELSNI